MTLACNGNVREPAVIESVSITCPLHEWTDCWHVMAAASSKLGGGKGEQGQRNNTWDVRPSAPWRRVLSGLQHWTPTLAARIYGGKHS